MGQGGYLVLINGTPYDWKKISCDSKQMKWWQFPENIPAGTVSKVFIQWSENIFKDVTADSGEASYKLCGTMHSFEVQALNLRGFNLQVELQAIATMGNPEGSTIQLGWKRNGFVYFVLSGTEGQFSSTNPPISWMQNNLSTLGHRSLRHLCIPGTHNSGMSRSSSSTFANRWIVTQRGPIISQLEYGVRYLDCRPVISAGSFVTGNYSDLLTLGTQGGNGQSFGEIIQEINTFTQDNQELIILSLSHGLNLDVVQGREYRTLNQAEWHRLLEQLTGDQGLNHLFVAPNPTSVDLCKLPLEQFIGTNQAAVIILIRPDDPRVTLDEYHYRGAYNSSQMNVIKRDSHTHKVEHMVREQLQLMGSHGKRTSTDSPLVLLSWIYRNSLSVASGSSVLKLSEKTLPPLYTELVPECHSRRTYPNILYLDGLDSSDITALAMAINDIAAVSDGSLTSQFNPQPQIQDGDSSGNSTFELGNIPVISGAKFTQSPQQDDGDFNEGLDSGDDMAQAPDGNNARQFNPQPQIHGRGSSGDSAFGHSSNITINGGQFIQSTQQVNDGFNKLFNASADDAMHLSVKRMKIPKCPPEAHGPVFEKIVRWASVQKIFVPSIMWLLGSEGAGKSVISQALAERCKAEGTFLASFCFSRDDPSRNHALPLFTTIAYQVAVNFHESRNFVCTVPELDPSTLKQCPDSQLTSLIIEPLQQLYQVTGRLTGPYLVVIDGLDQCVDSEVQINILSSISKAVKKCPFPLKFFITSRPEPHIVAELNSDAVKPILNSHDLDEFHSGSDSDNSDM